MHSDDRHHFATLPWVGMPEPAGVDFIAIQKAWKRLPKLDPERLIEYGRPAEIFTPQRVGGQFDYHRLIEEGLLREVLPGVACASVEPDCVNLRVAVARQVTRGLGIVALNAARWVYEGGKTPDIFDCYYMPYTLRPQGNRVRGLKRRLYPQDLNQILGLTLTAPHRTARDLELSYEILEPVMR